LFNSTMSIASGTSVMSTIGYVCQSTESTRVASKRTCSCIARLIAWIRFASIVPLSESGLTTRPQSCATVNRVTR